MSQENFTFKTEDSRLLDLVINSLYSEKDIFLRELVSNASDAINKLKFEATTQPELIEEDPEFKIHVKIDPKIKALIISDNGIGMSKDEIIANLGTIARSGSHEFLTQQDKASTADIIGQFGVGFYSVFMVAKSVDVYTTRAGTEQTHKFSSQGTGSFSIEQVEKLSRGTQIVVYLKDETYLEQYTVRQIIEKYSQYTSTPIYLEHFVEPVAEQSSEEAEKTSTEGSFQSEKINESQPLWLTSKESISQEQYNEFYKSISRDFRDPLPLTIHSKVEGQSTYSFLFFIPSEQPFYMLHQETPRGVKLHVKRIFITDDSEKLLPRYLGFISGIVDFEDLPLNVSRELLQENKVIQRTKKALTKKVLSQLNSMSKNDPEMFEKVWNNFGQMLKMFPNEDHENKDSIMPLLRFRSSTAQGLTSFDQYMQRMDEKQDKIYYIAAPTEDAALNSPHMDYFKDNNIEVLVLLDKIDESLLTYLAQYKDKKFVSVSSAEITSSQEESKEEKDEQEKQDVSKPELCTELEKILKDKVKEVKVSKRLSSSPACLVVEGGATMYMQRLMQEAGQSMPSALPTLEINVEHNLVKRMSGAPSESVEKWGHILYSLAMLAEGGTLSDPATFAKTITTMLEES